MSHPAQSRPAPSICKEQKAFLRFLPCPHLTSTRIQSFLILIRTFVPSTVLLYRQSFVSSHRSIHTHTLSPEPALPQASSGFHLSSRSCADVDRRFDFPFVKFFREDPKRLLESLNKHYPRRNLIRSPNKSGNAFHSQALHPPLPLHRTLPNRPPQPGRSARNVRQHQRHQREKWVRLWCRSYDP